MMPNAHPTTNTGTGLGLIPVCLSSHMVASSRGTLVGLYHQSKIRDRKQCNTAMQRAGEQAGGHGLTCLLEHVGIHNRQVSLPVP